MGITQQVLSETWGRPKHLGANPGQAVPLQGEQFPAPACRAPGHGSKKQGTILW